MCKDIRSGNNKVGWGSVMCKDIPSGNNKVGWGQRCVRISHQVITQWGKSEMFKDIRSGNNKVG